MRIRAKHPFPTRNLSLGMTECHFGFVINRNNFQGTQKPTITYTMTNELTKSVETCYDSN